MWQSCPGQPTGIAAAEGPPASLTHASPHAAARRTPKDLSGTCTAVVWLRSSALLSLNRQSSSMMLRREGEDVLTWRERCCTGYATRAPQPECHLRPCLACRSVDLILCWQKMGLHGVRYCLLKQEMEIAPLVSNREDLPSAAEPSLFWVSSPNQQQHLRHLRESANPAALVHRLSITHPCSQLARGQASE